MESIQMRSINMRLFLICLSVIVACSKPAHAFEHSFDMENDSWWFSVGGPIGDWREGSYQGDQVLDLAEGLYLLERFQGEIVREGTILAVDEDAALLEVRRFGSRLLDKLPSDEYSISVYAFSYFHCGFASSYATCSIDGARWGADYSSLPIFPGLNYLISAEAIFESSYTDWPKDDGAGGPRSCGLAQAWVHIDFPDHQEYWGAYLNDSSQGERYFHAAVYSGDLPPWDPPYVTEDAWLLF